MPHRTHSTIKKKYGKELGDLKSFPKPKSKNKSRYLKGGKINPQKI
jgi:hypothetical protein